jgi:hypothetical protein
LAQIKTKNQVLSEEYPEKLIEKKEAYIKCFPWEGKQYTEPYLRERRPITIG